MTILIRLYLVLFGFCLLSACFSFGGDEQQTLHSDDGQIHYYIIDVDRGTVANEFVHDRVLLLKTVRVLPFFKAKNLVMRTGENEYTPLAEHQFFSQPDEIFTQQLRRWLLKSGLFSEVIVDIGQPVRADYVLESAVTALYADMRPAYTPKAVVEMQFFMDLADEDNGVVTFQTGLRVEVDMEQSTPGKAVAEWKRGVKELLTNLEQDLSRYFSKAVPH